MTKKRKRLPRMTPEEEARREQTQRMVRERIAYHEQKAREEDARRAARERRLQPLRRVARAFRRGRVADQRRI
jgi:hypothetical protein